MLVDRPGAPYGYCLLCATPLEARRQDNTDRPTCPNCGFIRYIDPKVAVAVVLGDPQRGILLVLRNIHPAKGLWSFPAGYVDRGEVLEEAAAREVREEIGVEARVTRLVGAYSQRDNPVIVVVYAGEIVDGEPQPDGHEVAELGWFPPDALPDMAFGHDARIVADWQRQLAETAHPTVE